MNAAVDTARKFDNWSEEIPTSWTPTMFTSPFGESITAHDSQLWASPGNNLDDYYRPNHQSAREELVHDIDTSDNVSKYLFSSNIIIIIIPCIVAHFRAGLFLLLF